MLLFTQNLLNAAKKATAIGADTPPVLLMLLAGSLVVAVIGMIMQSIIFKKAGRKQWEAFIPFYNTWILSQYILKRPKWWINLDVIAPFIPIFNIIWAFQAAFTVPGQLCELFGYSKYWGILSGLSTIGGTLSILLVIVTLTNPALITLALTALVTGLLLLLFANIPYGIIAFGNNNFRDGKFLELQKD